MRKFSVICVVGLLAALLPTSAFALDVCVPLQVETSTPARVLLLQDSEVVDEKDCEKSVVFELSVADVGEYLYQVKQLVPKGAADVVYDETVYDVHLSVAQDSSGVSYAVAINKSDEKTKDPKVSFNNVAKVTPSPTPGGGDDDKDEPSVKPPSGADSKQGGSGNSSSSVLDKVLPKTGDDWLRILVPSIVVVTSALVGWFAFKRSREQDNE